MARSGAKTKPAGSSPGPRPIVGPEGETFVAEATVRAHLNRILRLVKNHHMVNPRIENGAVVFGIECVWPNGRVTVKKTVVRSMPEAMRELGY